MGSPAGDARGLGRRGAPLTRSSVPVVVGPLVLELVADRARARAGSTTPPPATSARARRASARSSGIPWRLRRARPPRRRSPRSAAHGKPRSRRHPRRAVRRRCRTRGSPTAPRRRARRSTAAAPPAPRARRRRDRRCSHRRSLGETRADHAVAGDESCEPILAHPLGPFGIAPVRPGSAPRSSSPTL